MKIYVSKDDNILTNYDGVITTLTILEEVEVSPIEEKDQEIAVLKKALELACKNEREQDIFYNKDNILTAITFPEMQIYYDFYIDQAKKELGGENE